jgi:hypothetical protein
MLILRVITRSLTTPLGGITANGEKHQQIMGLRVYHPPRSDVIHSLASIHKHGWRWARRLIAEALEQRLEHTVCLAVGCGGLHDIGP